MSVTTTVSRRPQRDATLAALVVAIGVLAVVLLVPVLFSDPNSVDPYGVRLAVAAGLLVLAAWRDRRLHPALPVLLAVAAFTVPYALWQASYAFFNTNLGRWAPEGGPEFFLSIAVQAVATVAISLLALRLAPRPVLRGQLTRRAFASGLLLVALFVVVGLAIPGQLLGRVAVQPVAFLRVALWLVPADLLQGALQELQFRGLLMGTLERVMKPWHANAVQALIFGLGHLALVYQGPEATIVPFTVLLGFLLGWVTQKTRSLWPAVMVHAVADVLVDAVVVPGLYGLT